MDTKVIFRKWQDGDIIAILPEDLGTNDPYTCMMYEHVGQHGAGDPQKVIKQTKLATPEEYQSLKEELDSIGYELEIIKRHRHQFTQNRVNELRRLNERFLKAQMEVT